MLAQERQSIILEMLKSKNIIKISNIAERFDITTETARKDLEALQSQRLVRRVYGGAVLESNPPSDASFRARTNTDAADKAALGRAAAALVKEGDVIFIGPGTTMLELARNIKHMNNITVLTNSLAVTNELATTNISLYVLGGLVGQDELSLQGTITLNSLQLFFADKAFISCGGITLSGGISDYGSEGQMLNAMLKRSNQKILVSSSVKFGQNSFSYVCNFDEVDIIISDSNLDKTYQNAIRERNVQLIITKPE